MALLDAFRVFSLICSLYFVFHPAREPFQGVTCLLIFLCKLQSTQLFPFLVYHDEFFFSLPIHVIHHGPYDIVLLIRHNKFLRFASVPPFCCNRPFKCHKYFPLFYFFMKNLENPKQKYENIQKCIDSKKL